MGCGGAFPVEVVELRGRVVSRTESWGLSVPVSVECGSSWPHGIDSDRRPAWTYARMRLLGRGYARDCRNFETTVWGVATPRDPGEAIVHPDICRHRLQVADEASFFSSSPARSEPAGPPGHARNRPSRPGSTAAQYPRRGHDRDPTGHLSWPSLGRFHDRIRAETGH